MIRRFLPILIIFIGLVGCRKEAATDKPIVTVSIEPLRWAAERLAGDKMEVHSLLGRGGNPENYEPAFSHLTSLEHSRVYMTVGNLGFEDAIRRRVEANNPDLRIVCTSDSIELIHATHGSQDHGADPHVWSSAANMRVMARNMLHVLCEIDPKNADTYQRNYERLAAHIDSVNAVCDSILAPMRGSTFVVWHPSLSYFARDYGLTQLSVGAEGKEHSVGETKELLDRVKETGAQVFLIQKDFDPSQARTLARELRTIVIDPMNYEWDTEMLHTARSIAGQ